MFLKFQQSFLRNRQLEPVIVTQDLAKIHGITAFQAPAFQQFASKRILTFHEEAHIMVLLVIRFVIRAKPFLPRRKHTILEPRQRPAVNPEKKSHETAVFHTDCAIAVVYRRTVKGIADNLPPMLPPGINRVVVEVVFSPDMV